MRRLMDALPSSLSALGNEQLFSNFLVLLNLNMTSDSKIPSPKLSILANNMSPN